MGRGNNREGEEEEYEVDELRDRIKSSRGSRFELIEKELGLNSSANRRFSRQSVINGLKDLSRGLVIHPENRSVQLSFYSCACLFFRSCFGLDFYVSVRVLS